MRLTAKDKRVINDFIDRKSIGSHSRRLWTDGHTLGTHGLGGGPIARWSKYEPSKNDTMVFNERGTVSEQTIRRYVLKLIPPRWVADESSWVLPERSRRLVRSQRDKSKKRLRPDVLMTRKTYTRKKGGVKVKKSQYRVKSRDPFQGQTQEGLARHIAAEYKIRKQTVTQLMKNYGLARSQAQMILDGAWHAYESNAAYGQKWFERWILAALMTLPGSGRQRDPQPNINPVCPVGTQVQTLILSQQFFNQREASSWIRRHGFRLTKIDESSNFWRFRQQDPNAFEKDSFRTIRLRPGVEAVIGCPRN